MGLDNFPGTSGVWGDVAQNLNMQGLHEQAEAVMASAPKFAAMPGDTENYQDGSSMLIAAIRLDAGNIEGAREAFASVKGTYSVETSWRHYWYFYLLGQLDCAAGDAKSGLSHLATAEQALSAHSTPNGPMLARIRAVIGLCALSNGNRKLAEQMTTQARSAFHEQPRVGPWFKEPLQRLDARLGTKTIH